MELWRSPWRMLALFAAGALSSLSRRIRRSAKMLQGEKELKVAEGPLPFDFAVRKATANFRSLKLAASRLQ